MKHVTRIVLCALAAVILALPLAAAPQQAQSAKIKPALLVIDIQNCYLTSMSEQDKKVAMETIPYLIDLFRKSGYPVITVYHHELGTDFKPGMEAFEFPKTIPVAKNDPRIIKNFPNGFKKTELEKVLREKGCNTLFLCGLSATGCVLATYHGALDLDFRAFMVKNAIISDDTALTKAVQEICQTIDYSALALLLQSLK
jgi:nicotinamidase-related amidase